tara:strand:- start:340 stop:516 length:177 start_codon:yes stop_codon:yes gene_type:complete
MKTKLEKKLARQAKQTERQMTMYRLGSKGPTRITFARNAHWNHINTTKVYYAHTRFEL